MGFLACTYFSLKELDGCFDRFWHANRTLFECNRLSCFRARERILTRTPAQRPEFELASMFATRGCPNDRYSLILQELGCKFRILLTDIRETGNRLGTAEDLCLQPVTPCTLLQQAIQQKLHQVDTIACRITTGHQRATSAGQKEIVHPPDTGHRITKTGRHARAQYCCKNNIRISHDLVLALNDMDPLCGGDI